MQFQQRPYLSAIYGVDDRNLVLRCSRQVEKSTLLCNRILFEATTTPGTKMVLVCPRQDQARVFSSSRLHPAIKGSPLIKRALLGDVKRPLQVMHLRFANESELFIRAAYHSADAARGLSADILLIDEVLVVDSGLEVRELRIDDAKGVGIDIYHV
jgi:transcriptional regulator of met regulon